MFFAKARTWFQDRTLQAKLTLVLLAVLIPTFLSLLVLETKLTRPLLEDELKQIGINTGKTIASDIVSTQLLYRKDAGAAIDRLIQEILYGQPHIIRVDIYRREPGPNSVKLIASNIEQSEEGEQVEDASPATVPNPDKAVSPLVVSHPIESISAELKTDDDLRYWDVQVPIEIKARDAKAPRKIIGSVHLIVSLRLMGKLISTLYRIKLFVGALSIIILFLFLRLFLRKALLNDRLLKMVQIQNTRLSDQLGEAERKLSNLEKLSVMGQLTASFAHEIGSPLNAIGGHLHLLEAKSPPENKARIQILQAQVEKIAQIVKNFLHNTSQPVSQRKLTDLHSAIEHTLLLIQPRLDSTSPTAIRVLRHFAPHSRPLRIAELELEQILLNLCNNAIDALTDASKKLGRTPLTLSISTVFQNQTASIVVRDNGIGISKQNLTQVTEPFFSTKRPGEGTGLGLTISKQLAQKYSGVLNVNSVENEYTEVTLTFHLESGLKLT